MTGNTSFKIANFRASLVHRLISSGHEVWVLAPADDYTETLQEMGCTTIDIKIDRNGTNIFKELRTLIAFYRSIRELRPHIVFSYTIKNNIYSGIACRMLGIKFAPNITGLGPAFNKNDLFNSLIKKIYRFSLQRSFRVFFQNVDDMKVMSEAQIVSTEIATLLPGSGVDVGKFKLEPMPNQSKVRFLLVARMLYDKGVVEFANAAKDLSSTFPHAEFYLLGPIDQDSKSSVSADEIKKWEDTGHIKYLGSQRDVRAHLRDADCIVLPTYYREGTPRALLEAASTGRPIITTDMPGCRDVVFDGKTGFLIQPKSTKSLKDALIKFMNLTREQRMLMGLAGRSFVEKSYDEKIVIKAYLDLVQN